MNLEIISGCLSTFVFTAVSCLIVSALVGRPLRIRMSRAAFQYKSSFSNNFLPIFDSFCRVDSGQWCSGSQVAQPKSSLRVRVVQPRSCSGVVVGPTSYLCLQMIQPNLFRNSSGAAEVVFKNSSCAGKFLSGPVFGGPQFLVYIYIYVYNY